MLLLPGLELMESCESWPFDQESSTLSLTTQLSPLPTPSQLTYNLHHLGPKKTLQTAHLPNVSTPFNVTVEQTCFNAKAKIAGLISLGQPDWTDEITHSKQQDLLTKTV